MHKLKKELHKYEGERAGRGRGREGIKRDLGMGYTPTSSGWSKACYMIVSWKSPICDPMLDTCKLRKER
jgi:hypothetical protein